MKMKRLLEELLAGIIKTSPFSQHISRFSWGKKTKIFALEVDVNTRYLIRISLQPQPKVFYNPFSKCSVLAFPVKTILLAEGIKFRHRSALWLAEVHVRLRCPRVHFHSACSCKIPPLREETASFLFQTRGRPEQDLEHVHGAGGLHWPRVLRFRVFYSSIENGFTVLLSANYLCYASLLG